MRMFADYFQVPNVRLVRQGEVDAQKLLTSSAVLITDYSSVAWDFSFLSRPVLFFQFDRRDNWSASGLRTSTTGRSCPDRSRRRHDSSSPCSARWSTPTSPWRRRTGPGPQPSWPTTTRETAPASTTMVDAGLDADAPRWTGCATRPGSSGAGGGSAAATGYFVWMRRLFALGRWLPRKNTVVFECDRGAHFGDAPRYLYERLVERTHGLKIVWANNTTLRLTDPQTRKIKRHSPTYYWELSRARFWVNNQNFPADLAKPTGTRFLQTWHGTPLKRMQHDVADHAQPRRGLPGARGPADQLLGPAALRQPVRDAVLPQRLPWNGPSPNSATRATTCSSGRMPPTRRELARNRLGLADDPRKIILYAPTFRDDNRPGRRTGRISWNSISTGWP